jgi:Protein of unknown function (DUF1579)
MSIPARLTRADGDWAGPSLLSFGPDHPTMTCESTAQVTREVTGTALMMRYDWSFEGKPHQGVLLLSDDAASARCEISWMDSFHYANRMMLLTGAAAGEGEVNVRGSYPAPTGPDWGWRMTLEMPDAETLLLRMFNITPDGQEAWAVEATYRRR